MEHHPPPQPSSPSRVQKVAKASSDQLLRKFAELDSDPPDAASARRTQLIRRPVRRKRTAPRRATAASGDGGAFYRCSEGQGRRTSAGFAEWNSALLPTTSAGRRPSSSTALLLRRVGVAGRTGVRAREIAGIGFILEALEKTWRKTIEGASRVLIEKHSNSHVRLISDIV